MPPTMVVPTERRPSAPAPVAKTSGSTPRMKANEVIRMGRRRSSAASIAASAMERPFAAQLLGKLDDQNRVFGRKADQHHEADLAIDVVGQPAQRHQPQRAEHRHRHGQQDDERQREAFVLRREREIDDQNAQAEDDERLAARLDFIEGQAGPLISHAGHHALLCQVLHARDALAGAVAGCGRTIDLDGAEEVVVGDDRRPGALRDGDEVVERHHLPGIGAHVVAVQVAGRHAERLIGLHKYAIGAVIEVEVVDVLRAHENAERGGDLREGNAHRLGLLAIDGDQHLRIVRRESRDTGR